MDLKNFQFSAFSFVGNGEVFGVPLAGRVPDRKMASAPKSVAKQRVAKKVAYVVQHNPKVPAKKR